jgi:putative transposase
LDAKSHGSHSLCKAEAKYGSTKSEFLALFESIHRCRPYLLGALFIVRCDNRALLYLQNFKDLTHRTARMLEILADYHFKMQFLAGKKNVSADALSRIE